MDKKLKKFLTKLKLLFLLPYQDNTTQDNTTQHNTRQHKTTCLTAVFLLFHLEFVCVVQNHTRTIQKRMKNNLN